MAMRTYVLGTQAVIKESGGKWFAARAPPWTGKPSARPAGVKARNTAFSAAASGCKTESKSKGGTVWGISAYNKCIGKRLAK